MEAYLTPEKYSQKDLRRLQRDRVLTQAEHREVADFLAIKAKGSLREPMKAQSSGITSDWLEQVLSRNPQIKLCEK